MRHLTMSDLFTILSDVEIEILDHFLLDRIDEDDDTALAMVASGVG